MPALRGEGRHVTWRYFTSESLVDGALVHTLDCGHVVAGRNRASDGEPVRRQWCPACWKEKPAWGSKPRTTLDLPEDDLRWLRAVLQSGLTRSDYERKDIASRVLTRVESALRKTG